jgi:Zyg-11 family protein
MLLLFSDPCFCRVTQANLRVPAGFVPDNRHLQAGLSCRFDDSAVGILHQHSLTDVDVSNRPHATGWSLESLAPHSSQSLKKLAMAGCRKYDDFRAIGKFKNLRVLNMSYCGIDDASLQLICEQLKHLSELDLTHCSQLNSLDSLVTLSGVLASLTLHGFKFAPNSMKALLKMTKLRHLDVSCNVEDPVTLWAMGMNHNREVISEHIPEIVQQLPNLESFDVSGSELNNDSVSCIDARAKKFQFFGLCFTDGIPSNEWTSQQAHLVTSDRQVEQIIHGLQRYISRSRYSQRLLHQLYQSLTEGGVDRQFLKPAFKTVVKVAEANIWDKKVLLSGTAAMYHLVRNKGYKEQEPQTMNALTTLLLAVIEGDDGCPPVQPIVRNCLLILLQYLTESSLVGPFREQLIQIALRYVYSSEDSTLTQIATCVLYNLGCSTTTEQKAQLCHLGVIKEMVALITRKKQANEFDMTTETATGLLWNITDECPPNCKEFIDCGGMELFMSVYKSNQNANALGAIRNLLGLLVWSKLE